MASMGRTVILLEWVGACLNWALPCQAASELQESTKFLNEAFILHI